MSDGFSSANAFNFGNTMFGMSIDHPMPPRFGELQRYLRGLEGYIERLGKTAPGRAKAESLASTVAERLSAMAETMQDRAARAGDDVSRYGARAAESGRDSLALVAKEISANPLAAVGAALGIGLVIGVSVALRRSTDPQAPRNGNTPRRARVRRVRKGSRK